MYCTVCDTRQCLWTFPFHDTCIVSNWNCATCRNHLQQSVTGTLTSSGSTYWHLVCTCSVNCRLTLNGLWLPGLYIFYYFSSVIIQHCLHFLLSSHPIHLFLVLLHKSSCVHFLSVVTISPCHLTAAVTLSYTLHLAICKAFTDLYLSLIHIWRCRRSTLCRSRWSPYH